MKKIKLLLITTTLIVACTTLITKNEVVAGISVAGAVAVLSAEIKTFKEALSMFSFK